MEMSAPTETGQRTKLYFNAKIQKVKFAAGLSQRCAANSRNRKPSPPLHSRTTLETSWEHSRNGFRCCYQLHRSYPSLPCQRKGCSTSKNWQTLPNLSQLLQHLQWRTFLTCRAKNTDACPVIAILYQCSLAREKQVDGKTKCLDFCFKTPKYKPGFLFPQSFRVQKSSVILTSTVQLEQNN